MVRAHKEADLSGSEAAGFEADGFRESENDRMLRAEIAVVGYRSALTILSKLLVVRDGFTLLGDLFQGRRRLKRQLTDSNRQGRMVSRLASWATRSNKEVETLPFSWALVIK
ncbi:hypothetical protein AnigIFM59636_003604 [Aspergillus niger]|nr:hypothetical protein AnigIFM59636_003604 [Aspergillus niger]